VLQQIGYTETDVDRLVSDRVVDAWEGRIS
jgi:hypothetical protein